MAGVITSLRLQKRNKERVNVYLDDEYAFALPINEALKLQKGQHLDDQEIAQLQTVDLEAKAYDRALRFLAVRPRSEREVHQNLKRYQPRKGETLDEPQIEKVIARLKERDYLDDHAFAAYWVEQRNRFKPMAPQALRYELRLKGIESKIADEIIEQATDPTVAALEAARQRGYRWQALSKEEFQKKMTAFLQRRGFHWEIIRDVVQQVWDEQEQQ
jgi:regulatory protein